jgi:PadR family transcriptional regulator, regulatory protein AphA
MSLEHAVLGFLNYQPLSGYDLKKMFDVSVRHFWPADQSQIYRTLTRLIEQGWAEMEVIEQSERPDRKVYHITAAGRDELLNWLAGEVPAQTNRTAPLIQVFFAAQLSDEEVLAIFERAAERVRGVLAHYDEVPIQLQALTETVRSPRERFFWDLTLESGTRTMQARLAWIEDVIQRIHKGEVPKR